MSDSLMHTKCLLCGKPAVSVPWHLEGLPYENYSYCPDCIHKAMKLLKHKNMTATWWEQNREYSNKPRLIGCSRCGRTWCVSPNVPYEEWIAERHYCGNCGSHMSLEIFRIGYLCILSGIMWAFSHMFRARGTTGSPIMIGQKRRRIRLLQ